MYLIQMHRNKQDNKILIIIRILKYGLLKIKIIMILWNLFHTAIMNYVLPQKFTQKNNFIQDSHLVFFFDVSNISRCIYYTGENVRSQNMLSGNDQLICSSTFVTMISFESHIQIAWMKGFIVDFLFNNSLP